MTYYCEKCGHQVDENQKRCAFCGAVQMRLTQENYKKKECKKCGKKIYVNANFCPYCGTDQAILVYKETPDGQIKFNDDDDQQGKKQDSDYLWNLNDSSNTDPSMDDFIKKMQESGIQIKQIHQLTPEERNETVHPGLIASTKLLIRDMFKVNKRLGVNDFWWGFLGFFLISCALCFASCWALIMMKVAVTKTLIFKISFGVAVLFDLSMTTAIIRRLHDIQISGWFVILWYTSIGRLLIFILCLLGPRLDNNPYTFSVNDWKNRQNKL